VFCKKCVLQLQTECKADNVLAVLQTWSEDQVHELMVSLVCKKETALSLGAGPDLTFYPKKRIALSLINVILQR
jgi:hypothetical protein